MNKANSIINKFLLTGDKFMPELHLVDPIVKKIVHVDHFQNTHKEFKIFKIQASYIYNNDLDKACFQHDMAYNKFKDLEKRTQSGIVLKNKTLKIASNPKYNGYERGLASMVYKFFDKKSKRARIKNEIKENQQLANELHKPIIRMFKKEKFILV